MDKAFTFLKGNLPILISMPHAGTKLTEIVERGLVDEAKSLPDTDWHIPRLYDFAKELGANILCAEYSRYVIDLNRSADDIPLYVGATTGLYPSTLFDGRPLFKPGLEPSAEERNQYLEHIWRPYHQKVRSELDRLKREYGKAVLFDAHSIRSFIPYLFEGVLPDFNFGTNSGTSCCQELESIVYASMGDDYTHVLNGRFKGGFITRGYGNPNDGIHAIQLELAQKNYMDEIEPFRYRDDIAPACQVQIKKILESIKTWANPKGQINQSRS